MRSIRDGSITRQCPVFRFRFLCSCESMCPGKRQRRRDGRSRDGKAGEGRAKRRRERGWEGEKGEEEGFGSTLGT